MDSRSVTCPRCGSTDVRYARRRDWERVLMVLRLRPYRCDNCWRRFWRIVSF